MNSEAILIYPHQLFKDPPWSDSKHATCWLVEDPLFFTQYAFHKQKLLLHRASMKFYQNYLETKGYRTHYIAAKELSHSSQILALLKAAGISQAALLKVEDDWLEQAILKGAKENEITLRWKETPGFLCSATWLDSYFSDLESYFFTSFYIAQRKRLNILLENGKPLGERWTFDTENRKKLPRDTLVPSLWKPPENKWVREAKAYISKEYAMNPGSLDSLHYPVTFEEAELWLAAFIRERFQRFGDYEDSISAHEATLFHSVLTPCLNIGLLTPKQIVASCMEAYEDIPLNSLEGFIRQVIGWREFIRAIYLREGRRQRTRNFWSHQRPIPKSFWNAQTGIQPVDTVIQRVLKTGYCHHIERLMVLGNFMLLCDFNPDEVYRWFMELFIDSYDWVMVPNVYGMSQYADGGLMTTKPYLSASNYICKMSDFPKGPWCKVFDGLYWRFIHKHSNFFAQNPRLWMMSSQLNRMPEGKLALHLSTAEGFLSQLS